MKKKSWTEPKVGVAFILSFLIGVFITFVNRELDWSNFIFAVCAAPVAFMLSKGVFLLFGIKESAESSAEKRAPVVITLSNLASGFSALVAFLFSLLP